MFAVVTHQQGAETWQNKLQCGNKHSEEDSKWIKMDVNNDGLEIHKKTPQDHFNKPIETKLTETFKIQLVECYLIRVFCKNSKLERGLVTDINCHLY